MTEEYLLIGLYVLSHGGTVTTRSFYDEEGVEGWEWVYDDREFTELGSWEGVPTVPDDLANYVKSKTEDWRK